MDTLTQIDVNAGESLDLDVTFLGEDGLALDVSGAQLTLAVHAQQAHTLVASDTVIFQRRNVAAGGASGEVEVPAGTGGSNSARFKIIPSLTASRGTYRYRVTAAWPAASPPVARIREGRFRIL